MVWGFAIISVVSTWLLFGAPGWDAWPNYRRKRKRAAWRADFYRQNPNWEENQRKKDQAVREACDAHNRAVRAAERAERHSTRRVERYSEREIVYVLERLTAEGRFFKIGMTRRNDVSRRAYECRSTIVGYTNSVRERDVHQELGSSRVSRRNLPSEITSDHGPTEWFRPTAEVERFAFDGVLPSGRTAAMVADRAA